MPLRIVNVNVKARDDQALGRFWADALGWSTDSEGPGVTSAYPDGLEWPDASAVCIDAVTVPDPETVHYRVRIELATESLEHRAALVERLLGLGATRLDAGFADPEGNVFRVQDPRPDESATGPIGAIVLECDHPRSQAAFWAAATDWVAVERPEQRDQHDGPARLRSAAGVGPFVEFVEAPGVPAPSRFHIDLKPYAADDQAAEVSRLHSLGAVDIDLGQGDSAWKCLADPEGNDFCVLAAG